MRKILFLLPLSILSLLAIAQQNTLVIIADDMGTDYCGFYENTGDTAKMPNIRALLARGVRFQNAWGTPYCSPSRSCLATGRYPFRTGVGTVIGGAGSGQLDTMEMSLAKLLKFYAPTRYATAHLGKWHMNVQTPQSQTYPTTAYGYDIFKGNFQGLINDYFNWSKITNGVSATVTNYATTETVNDAIAWLDTLNTNKPFFMWMAMNAPHSPFHKPPDGLHTVAGLTGTQAHINQNPKLYFKAMIEAMDTEIGRLLQSLAAQGRLENTNIIFVGDNGNAIRTSQIVADSARVKGSLYEGGVRIPLIVAGPVVTNPNRVSAALVSITDLFSTILEMNGFSNWLNFIPSLKKPVDAKSFLPILKNQSTAVRTWNFTEQFNSTPATVNGKAIRNASYKLIRFDNSQQAFYNLATDPSERTNLLNRNLTTTELTNYNFLCNELSNLVGTNRCLALPTDEVEALGIKISPTLFSDQIRIESKTAFDFELVDMQGRSILVGKSLGDKIIGTANLNAGFYLLKVKTAVGFATQKIMKT